MSDVEPQPEQRFQSIEEVMEYVDREARLRVEKLMDRHRTLAEGEPYDQVILKMLRESKHPLNVDLISFLTGISKSRCCKVLKSLEEKWKLIKKVTVSRVAYYEAVS